MELQDNQNPKWVTTRKFFSEALLVALLTGVGYLAAFAYQYNYLKYFNIPAFFIDINLVQVLFTTSVGLICLMGLGMAINFFTKRKSDKKSLKIIRQVGIFITFLILISPIIVKIYDPSIAWLFVILFFVLFVSLVIVVIRLYRNPELLDKIEDKRSKDDFLSRTEQIYGTFPVLFVLILFFFVAYSGIMGELVAKYKSKYLVSNTSPNLIIISTYSDSFIGLTFSTSTLKFNREITLLSKDNISENAIIFSVEEVGRLTAN